jgi:hypothetical protein
MEAVQSSNMAVLVAVGTSCSKQHGLKSLSRVYCNACDGKKLVLPWVKRLAVQRQYLIDAGASNAHRHKIFAVCGPRDPTNQRNVEGDLPGLRRLRNEGPVLRTGAAHQERCHERNVEKNRCGLRGEAGCGRIR